MSAHHREHPSAHHEVVSPQQERLRGKEDASALLHLYPTADSLHDQAAYATKNKQHKYAAAFTLLETSQSFIDTSVKLDDVSERLRINRYSNSQQYFHDRKEREALRSQVFPFNEAVKEFLNQYPDEPLEYVASLADTSHKVAARNAGKSSREDSYNRIYAVAVGMRAELAAESILGRFVEDVDFHYDESDNLELRRKLDEKGVDYIIDVTALGKTFELGVDIKSNINNTIDEDGYALPGKLWCQFNSQDFVNNSTRVRTRSLYSKVDSMRRDLLTQIRYQYPGKLEALCDEHNEDIDDIDLN